ncbi:hypothetical protein HUJ04_013189, partial [Dendroctonus ponderosae]
KTPTPRQLIFSIFKVVLLLLLLLRWPLESNAHQMRHVEEEFRYYNVGVLMASNLNYPFDLERCGPAVDMALEEVNEKFLAQHRIKLLKVQKSYPSCSGVLAPGLASDMHFVSDVIAFIGPACLFALEPVARLAAYWNTPIITGMGDQPPSEGELSVTSRILGRSGIRTHALKEDQNAQNPQLTGKETLSLAP